MAVMTTSSPPLPTLSTLQLVFIGLVGLAAYFVYSYRDGRAIGTNPRPDLVPFRSTKQTLFLGDFLTLLREKDRLLDNFLQRQREDGHLLKEDPSRAFTITLPGMRMVLISKSEVRPPSSFPPHVLCRAGCSRTALNWADCGRLSAKKLTRGFSLRSTSPTSKRTRSATTAKGRSSKTSCNRSWASRESLSRTGTSGSKSQVHPPSRGVALSEKYRHSKRLTGDRDSLRRRVPRIQRKATSKIFTAGNFKGIITSSIQEHIRQLVTVIGDHADKNEEFDLSDLFFRFTLDSFTEMAFGKSTRSLETSEPVPFAVAFDYAQGIMDRRFNK